MLIHKAYKYKLDLDLKDQAFCSRIAGCKRLIYNIALQQRSTAYANQRISVSQAAQDRELTQLKKDYPFLAEVPSQVLQQGLADLQRAFVNFFEHRADYPKPKKKYRHDSFRFPQPSQFKVDSDLSMVKLPKLGWLKFFNGQGKDKLVPQGTPQSITVSRQADGWYFSLTCEVEQVEPTRPAGEPVGLDIGIKKSIALSTGEIIQAPRISKSEQKRRARLHRDLSRKKKGSKNRRKAAQKLARFEQKLARRRLDHQHKTTTKLAKSYPVLCMEDLNVKGMTKAPAPKPDPLRPGTFLTNRKRAKAGLNQALLDVAPGTIRRLLEYKTTWYGSRLVLNPPAYTSQCCSACGHTEAANRKNQAEFVCQKCGFQSNADVNAAIVNKQLGLLQLETGQVQKLVPSSPLVVSQGQPVDALPIARRRNRNLSV